MARYRRSAMRLIAIPALLLLALPCNAEFRGLIVGIDDYRHEAKVEGAASDAEDIAAALHKLGAASVTVLLNQDATRDHLELLWNKIAAEAKPGDTLVLVFAGHGSREVHNRAGDGVNAFLLANFNRRTKAGFAERVTDDDIRRWFRATDQAVRIIFVADTCHSGSMMRSVDGRATSSERAVAPYGLPDWAKVPILNRRDSELKHVTFLAATEEDRKIQAVPIEGRARGALSYAFARVLERAAAENGILRRVHLESYVRPIVRQLSEGRQIPKILPRLAEPTDVLLVGRPSPDALLPKSGGALRIKVLNLDTTNVLKLVSSLSGAVPVTGAERPDLIWDARDGSVLTGQGDIAAYEVLPGQLQAVVDRWLVVTHVRQLAVQRPLAMSLVPGDQRQPSGRTIAFLSDAPSHPYLTSFNLEPDGTIRLLYPRARFSDPHQWPAGKPYRLDLKVVPPYGAEHLVVISSSQPLDTIHSHLQHTRASDLPNLLTASLVGIEFQIGIQALYTLDAAMER